MHKEIPATCCAVHPPRPLALGQGGLTMVRGVAAILNTVAVAPFPDSLLSGCVAFFQDPSRFITRLNGRPYLWSYCRLAMTSTLHWCLRSEYLPSTDLATKAQNDEGLCDHPGWTGNHYLGVKFRVRGARSARS